MASNKKSSTKNTPHHNQYIQDQRSLKDSTSLYSSKYNSSRQQTSKNNTSKAIIPQFSSDHNFNINQNLNHLSLLLSILDRHQNTLQATRQALTQRSDFNPQTLFKYISSNQSEITRKHIINVFYQNQQYIHQEQLKIIFSLYGSKDKQKDKINYSTFLNFIYPYNIQTLKTISTVNIKKYAKNINQPLNQQILCLFIMIIKGQVNFLREFQTSKCDLFGRISRDKIKKLIKGLKKSNDNTKSNAQFKSDVTVTFQQMKAFLKKMKKTPQNRINSVCRRLSMGKQQGFINLQQLQFWLKSWNKMKNEDGTFFDKQSRQRTLFDELSSQIQSAEM